MLCPHKLHFPYQNSYCSLMHEFISQGLCPVFPSARKRRAARERCCVCCCNCEYAVPCKPYNCRIEKGIWGAEWVNINIVKPPAFQQEHIGILAEYLSFNPIHLKVFLYALRSFVVIECNALYLALFQLLKESYSPYS